VSEPTKTKPAWNDLIGFLTPMQIARLRMLESASTLARDGGEWVDAKRD
jgi:hypothetical protein